MKDIDFLPKRFHEARQRRQINRRNVVLFAILIGALCLLYITNESRIRTVSAARTTLHDQEVDYQSLNARLGGIREQKRQLIRHTDLVSRFDDDAPLDAVIAEMVRMMSDSMAISRMEVDIERTESVGSQGAGSRPGVQWGSTSVSIGGYAVADVEVHVFLTNLSQSPLFDDVRLGPLRPGEVHGRKVRQFEIQFKIRRVTIES
jgi:hypothetical protein